MNKGKNINDAKFASDFKIDLSNIPTVMDDAIAETTEAVLASVTPENAPSPSTIKKKIMEQEHLVFLMHNNNKSACKWNEPKTLSPAQVSKILLKTHYIVNIVQVGLPAEHPLLAVYDPKTGVYRNDRQLFIKLIVPYLPNAEANQRQKVIDILSDDAPIRYECQDPSLALLKNGVYNSDKRTLEPFSPDNIILSTSAAEYVEEGDRIAPQIPYNDGSGIWNFDSWLEDVFTVPGRTQEQIDAYVHLAHQVIYACLFPYIHTDKAVILYDKYGRSGKGTFLTFLRTLVGDGNYTTLSIQQFEKEFYLSGIIGTHLICSDESDTNGYLSSCSNFKDVITGDVLKINVKQSPLVDYAFHGIVVMCMNALPKFADKTESVARRLLVIPFIHNISEKNEHPEIKEDFLKRPEVLNYVASCVIDEFARKEWNGFDQVPDESNGLLEELLNDNDSVRAFWEDFQSDKPFRLGDFMDKIDDYRKFTGRYSHYDEVSDKQRDTYVGWAFLCRKIPRELLYDAYCGWYQKNHAGHTTDVQMSTFWKSIEQFAQEDPALVVYGRGKSFKISDLDVSCLRAFVHHFGGMIKSIKDSRSWEYIKDYWPDITMTYHYGIVFHRWDGNSETEEEKTIRTEIYNSIPNADKIGKYDGDKTFYSADFNLTSPVNQEAVKNKDK